MIIKSCPLCDSDCVKVWVHGQFDREVDGLCRDCGCSAPVERWNAERAHPTAQPDVVREALEDARKLIEARFVELGQAGGNMMGPHLTNPVRTAWEMHRAVLKQVEQALATPAPSASQDTK